MCFLDPVDDFASSLALAADSFGGDVLGFSLSSAMATPGMSREFLGLFDVDRLASRSALFDFSLTGDLRCFFPFPARS